MIGARRGRVGVKLQIIEYDRKLLGNMLVYSFAAMGSAVPVFVH